MLSNFRKPSTQEATEFLANQGPFDLAVTVNLKKRHPIHQINNSIEQAEKSGYWLIKRLNESIFKRKYRAGYKQLNLICCVEKGSIKKRLHLHLALGIPTHINQSEFIDNLKKIHKKMDWAYGGIHLSPYLTDGWIEYISKEGFDSVLL